MGQNCAIIWSDGTKFECELEPVHIENLSELACVVSVDVL